MAESPATLVALLFGPDQSGIVARVSGWIFENGGNIIHADQHRDQEEGIFFQRIEWSAGNGALAAMGERFREFAENLGMTVTVAESHRPVRMAVMVSKADHCFHDLVLRWRAGEFNGEIAGVLSNHEALAGAAASYGLPFEVVPVSSASKPDAEARQLAILKEWNVDVVVLARYMQILSPEFLRSFARPVINIHHSFLPAFAGGRPYHQAYARGVKLIGATAHYVTAKLDDGPIIHQDVIRVSHRHNVSDLIRRGRHLEKMVLSQAVAWHLEHRILVYGNKTVVFD